MNWYENELRLRVDGFHYVIIMSTITYNYSFSAENEITAIQEDLVWNASCWLNTSTYE